MIRAAIAAAASLLLVAACTSDNPNEQPCKDVPDGGCPLSHGVACDDPSCLAVYACFGGQWSLDHVCPAREAGAPADASARSDAGDANAGSFDASIDAPPGAFGGPGCPDLQAPDCPLGDALQCPPSSSCCGCADLFVCQNGGWVPYGSCVDGGIATK